MFKPTHAGWVLRGAGLQDARPVAAARKMPKLERLVILTNVLRSSQTAHERLGAVGENLSWGGW